MTRKLFILLYLLLMSSVSYSQAAQVKDIPEDVQNYIRLSKIFIDYKAGLFGSRKYHEKELRSFLTWLIGREITTDYSYMLISPEGIHGSGVSNSMRFDRWLYIFGDLDVESVKPFLNDDPKIIQRWWRTTNLVAVTGKVRKYKISRDPYGPTVELYLEKIKILHPEKRIEEKKL